MGARDQQAVRLRTAQDAARVFWPAFRDCMHEKLIVAHIGADGWLLGLVEQAGGHPDRIDLPLRNIITDAIALGSDALLLAHCHPSGDPRPSAADIAATRRLARVADELGISLRDHLIFAGSGCRSFRGLGLL